MGRILLFGILCGLLSCRQTVQQDHPIAYAREYIDTPDYFFAKRKPYIFRDTFYVSKNVIGGYVASRCRWQKEQNATDSWNPVSEELHTGYLVSEESSPEFPLIVTGIIIYDLRWNRDRSLLYDLRKPGEKWKRIK